jgi:cytoskeletal protein RodZ
MAGFFIKVSMSKIVGRRLREARTYRRMSLEEASRLTRIKLDYLKAMEAGDFEALPSRVQARGFLRSYAGILGLDAEALLEDLGEVLVSGAGAQRKFQVVESSPQTEVLPKGEADEIFADIGRTLRERRELLGLSLEEVEHHTHVRLRYLQALERGAFDELPSFVQGRGMLNNYSEFLGLEAEPLLLRFAEGLQARLPRRTGRLKKDVVGKGTSGWRRLLSGDLLFGVPLAVVLFAFIIWGIGRVGALRGGSREEPTAPPIVAVLLASPSPTSSGIVGVTPTAKQFGLSTQPAQTLEAPPAPESNAPVQVYLIVRQRTWVRVTVDDVIQLEGRVIPGSTYPFAGQQTVEVLTGNGAALEVTYNGISLGPLGIYGEVVDRIFTAEGLQTPTPTVTLTPTATPLISLTAEGQPSETPTPGLGAP